MAKSGGPAVEYSRVELGGVAYVILREAVFQNLCRKAKVRPAVDDAKAETLSPEWGIDRRSLAEKLAHRRRAVGWSQAELAQRAGIRPETLNRIERGRTDPDFATIRKLVEAMNAAEVSAAGL